MRGRRMNERVPWSDSLQPSPATSGHLLHDSPSDPKASSRGSGLVNRSAGKDGRGCAASPKPCRSDASLPLAQSTSPKLN